MRFRIALFSISFLTLVFGFRAQAQDAVSVDTVETNLYNYIYETQLNESADARANGEWQIYSILNGGSLLGVEANSFLAAQQLVALTEVNRYRPLPEFSQLRARALANLQSYVADTARLGDPTGLIAYFPITDLATRTRGVQIPITKLVKSFNVPTDLDSSSALAMYYELSGTGASYLNSYATAVGRFRDLDRTVEHPHDQQWKPANSGAFLTWGDPDRVVDPNSRIFNGVNDVDCVVDLNVLAATSAFRRSHGTLPAATAAGVASTCSLTNETVNNARFNRCAVWYDRSSQFWYSYARAVTDGASCLAPSVATARTNIVAEAQRLTSTVPVAERNMATETAELMIALKRLYPPHARTAQINDLLSRLVERLAAFTVIKDEQAYPSTQDSLYLAIGFGMRLDWYSTAYSASLELLALTLP